MNRYRSVSASGAALVALALGGCGEEARTAQWYMAHGTELQAKLEECKKYPSLNESDANCRNANEAFATLISATKNPQTEPADAH
jgi:hypothetical protein